jgi:hypothetical protein
VAQAGAGLIARPGSSASSAGNVARLVVAGGGGWLALRWGGGIVSVFWAQAMALSGEGHADLPENRCLPSP